MRRLPAFLCRPDKTKLELGGVAEQEVGISGGAALANGLLLLATQPRGNGGSSINDLLLAEPGPWRTYPALAPLL